MGSNLISAVNTALTTLLENFLRLSNEWSLAKDELDDLKKDTTHLTTNVHRLEKDTVSLRRLVDQLERDTSSSQRRANRLEVQVLTFRGGYVEALDGETLGLKTKVNHLDDKYDSIDGKFDSLNAVHRSMDLIAARRKSSTSALAPACPTPVSDE